MGVIPGRGGSGFRVAEIVCYTRVLGIGVCFETRA